MEKEKVLKKQKYYDRASFAAIMAFFVGGGIFLLSGVGFIGTMIGEVAWEDAYKDSMSEQYSAYVMTQKEEAQNKVYNHEMTIENYEDYVASFNFEGFLKDTNSEKLADYQSIQNSFRTAKIALGSIGVALGVGTIASAIVGKVTLDKEQEYALKAMDLNDDLEYPEF